MKYTQLTDEERHLIGYLRRKRFTMRAIARELNRAPSTISREIKRNLYHYDGSYKPYHAIKFSKIRRYRSRSHGHFTRTHWKEIDRLIKKDFSPEQISGYLRLHNHFEISHETIYKYLLKDKKNGGNLWKHLRCAQKLRRKRYNSYDSRGRLYGKRHISERPIEAEERLETGHWEIDTVMGSTKACILTLVDRLSGYVMIGKLNRRTVEQTNLRLHQMIKKLHHKVYTITADNGSEFHGYKKIEKRHDLKVYFANPHHSWERGSNENTNGLIRQYLPKGQSMDQLTQAKCNAIADKLNHRPRKRHGFKTPYQIFQQSQSVALAT